MRLTIANVSLLGFLVVPAFAQQFGKADNLAPYIPSPQAVVDRMLEAARIKPGEVVYDLGSGDGRVVITAAQKYRAKAVGVEISSDLCRRAEARIKELGLQDRVKIVHNSALRVDLSGADVVTMYLLTSSNDVLKPRLEQSLKPGARVVSTDFPVPGWKPRETIRLQMDDKVAHTIYVYEMAARSKAH